MGHDEPHAPARFVVGNAVALMAEHTEHGDTCHRLVEGRSNEINQPLGLGPFEVKPALHEFLVGNQINRGYRLIHFSKEMPSRGRIEFDIMFKIDMLVVLFDAVAIGHKSCLARRIFGK